MNVTFWLLIAFGGTATPIDIVERFTTIDIVERCTTFDIVERFTTEHYCESVRKAMPSAQQAIAKCVQATVAR